MSSTGLVTHRLPTLSYVVRLAPARTAGDWFGRPIQTVHSIGIAVVLGPSLTSSLDRLGLRIPVAVGTPVICANRLKGSIKRSLIENLYLRSGFRHRTLG